MWWWRSARRAWIRRSRPICYAVGTLAVVHKVVRMPNQSLFVFAEGLERVRVTEYTQLTPFMRATVETIPEVPVPKSSEIEALQRNVLTLFQQIVAGSPTLSDELSTVAVNIEDAGRMVDFIASSLPSLSTRDKQDVLETPDVHVRLEKINQHLAKELEVQQLRNKIQSEVQDRVQQTQREYYLREQMKAIQKELGEQDETTRDAEELRQKIEAGRHARRREEGGAEGAGPAGAHVADGCRLRPDPQLHRVAGGAAVAEVVGRAKWTSRRRRRSSTPTTTIWRR